MDGARLERDLRDGDVSVSVTGGPRGDGLFRRELLNPGTSTAAQSVALTTQLTVLSTATGGTGTATGFEVNVFSLSTASAVEGQEKVVLMTGTGEAKLSFTGTATGRLVLTAADDIAHLVFLNEKWRIKETSATFATAT